MTNNAGSTEPPPTAPLLNLSQPFRFLASFVALVVLSVITVIRSLQDTSYLNDVFGSADGPAESLIGAQWVCLVFLLMHHFRVWFGLKFMRYDESFLDAKSVLENKLCPAQLASFRRKHGALEGVLTAMSLLFLAAINFTIASVWGVFGLNFVLALQAICIIWLVLMYWDILIKGDNPKINDKEYAANRFIVVGDIVTGFMIIIVIASSSSSAWERPWNQHFLTGAFLFLTGGLAVVFAGELWSQYWRAVMLNVRQIFPKKAKP